MRSEAQIKSINGIWVAWISSIIQLLNMILVILAILGYKIPVIQEITGFISLTFIPGMVIFRLLDNSQKSFLEFILYSVGLSIIFVMFLGAIIDFIFPLIDITQPISPLPLVLTISVIVLVLNLFLYRKERNRNNPIAIDFSILVSPWGLICLLLPLLSVLGAKFVYHEQNNSTFLIMLAIIAFIPVLAIIFKLISERYFPLIIFSSSLALLFHSTLISPNLIGWDIHLEYYYAENVLNSGIWDSSIVHPYNAMLSVVMTGPIYSIICGTELVEVFKVIIPALYAFVPLGLYFIYARQAGNKIAFLAAFFFISVPVYYTSMVTMVREPIAEFISVCIIMFIVCKPMNKIRRVITFIMVCLALIFSHYGEALVFLLSLPLVYLIVLIFNKFFNYISTRKPRNKETIPLKESSSAGDNSKTDKLVTPIVIISAALGIAWYFWGPGASIFSSIFLRFQDIFSSLFGSFGVADTSQSLSLVVTSRSSLLHNIGKYLYLFTQFLIAVGVLNLIVHWKTKKYNDEFSAFALVNVSILAATLVIPFLDKSFHITRLYLIMLMFLAPFCIMGLISVFSFIAKITRKTVVSNTIPLSIFAALIMIFSLFNSGLIYELTQDSPSSRSLSQNWILDSSDNRSIATYFSAITTDSEVKSAQWLSEYSENNRLIYADDDRTSHVLLSSGGFQVHYDHGLNSSEIILGPAYIYLGEQNIVYNLISRSSWDGIYLWNYENIDKNSEVIRDTPLIYTNGKSRVYYTTGSSNES